MKSSLINSVPLNYIILNYTEVAITVLSVIFLFKGNCFVQGLVGEFLMGKKEEHGLC